MNKEHPILMSAPMVKAILDGRKTQTRRVIKKQPISGSPVYWHGGCPTSNMSLCPYGSVGDHLWVRETWTYYSESRPQIIYKADGKAIEYPNQPQCMGYGAGSSWRPSIFMPRWASRITLEITDIRVQRVQEISKEDAVAEGMSPEVNPLDAPPAMLYANLWDIINSKRGYSWDSNPWVWAISFKVVNP